MKKIQLVFLFSLLHRWPTGHHFTKYALGSVFSSGCGSRSGIFNRVDIACLRYDAWSNDSSLETAPSDPSLSDVLLRYNSDGPHCESLLKGHHRSRYNRPSNNANVANVLPSSEFSKLFPLVNVCSSVHRPRFPLF